MLIINLVKKLFFLIQAIFIYPFLALPAFADTQINPCSDSSNPIANALCNLGGANVARTLQNIVIFIVIIAVLVALLYLLYGGIKWITSKGEKTEVEAARNHITAAIAGLIIVFLAIFILTLILAAFGLNLSNLTIPSITSH